MIRPSLASSLAVFVAACSVVRAQPSPDVQRRISAAIKAAIVNGSGTLDYTAFVNPFIGTGTSLSLTELKLESNIKYTILSYQTILEMYGSCPVCNEALSTCQHTLSLAQPRRICPIWHGMLCPVMSQKMMFET